METITLIRDGEKWGKREIICLLLHRQHQNVSCIKMGSNESHFNVSFIVRDKVPRRHPQTVTFEEKGEPKRIQIKAQPPLPDDVGLNVLGCPWMVHLNVSLPFYIPCNKWGGGGAYWNHCVHLSVSPALYRVCLVAFCFEQLLFLLLLFVLRVFFFCGWCQGCIYEPVETERPHYAH